MNITTEILAVAHKYLKKVRPSGAENVMSICPFHLHPDGSEEQHPSFAMSVVTGVYFCHACHAKGTLGQFFRDLGMSRYVVQTQYGVLIDEARKNLPAQIDPSRPEGFDEVPINESFLGLLDYCPLPLLEEGFEESTLQHFEVGYDQWHQKITFPLRDIKGQLVGMSGRRLDALKPKYKIYDEEYTSWQLPPRYGWNKRNVLYNAHEVIPTAHLLSPKDVMIVVVEGFKACMWVWQSGIKDVVATLGTYVSRTQRGMLERRGGTVYLFMDNNEPGIVGVVDAGDELLECNNVDTYVVKYPERLVDDVKAQPDSLTAEEVRAQVASAVTYQEWIREAQGQSA